MHGIFGRLPKPVRQPLRTRPRAARLVALAVLAASSTLGFTGQTSAGPSTPPQGYLEICKETRDGLTGAFEFTFANRTTSITVTKGATQPVCTAGVQVNAGQVNVTERSQTAVEPCGIRTIQPGRLTRAQGSSATVVVPAGGPEAESTVVFCNRPAPKGSLQICKETQGGLSGTFTFDFAGRSASVNVPKDAKEPTCTGSFEVPAGQVSVTERGVGSAGPCGVRTLPVGRIVSASGRAAWVTVPTGDQTVVVFCNVAVDKGALQICKVAGPGVAPGTTFTFTIRDTTTGAITTVVVPAGQCLPAGLFGDGTIVQVTETLPDGTVVSDLDVSPSGRTRTCQLVRPERICVVVNAGGTTVVTFTNRKVEEQGHLRICKTAGSGITAGTSFTFTIRNRATGATTTVVVPAGQCAAAGDFDHGTHVEVTETLPDGVEVSRRSVSPGSSEELCFPVLPNRACAAITGGATTDVKFTDRRVVRRGLLKVCKVAGSGVTPGTNFTFALRNTATGAKSTVVVPADQCVVAGAFEDGSTVEITEAVPLGIEVSDRSVTPIQLLQPCASPQSNRVCAGIVGEQVTQVSFTDRKVGAKAAIQLCKVAGSAGITGSYSFVVRLLPSGPSKTVTVPVGGCVTVGDYPVSATLEITEVVPSDEVADLAVVPANEARSCPIPFANRVCVNVSSTVTKVVATNRKVVPPPPAPATLRVCKVAGLGVPNGAPYAFTIRLSTGQSTDTTVATGSCVSVPGIAPDTNAEVTETLPEGSEVPPTITISPVAATRTCATPLPTRACANLAAGSTVELQFTNRAAG